MPSYSLLYFIVLNIHILSKLFAFGTEYVRFFGNHSFNLFTSLPSVSISTLDFVNAIAFS